MTDLRELNSAVQNATFPSIQFAQTVRDWIAAATEMLEHKADSDPCLATFLPAFSGFKEAHVCQLAKGHGGYHESPNEVGGVARWIGYGRPILAEPASEGAKVECPNCGEMASEPHTIPDCLLPMSPSLWTCKPAQPEREISDGCGSTWLKCERANCGLEVVRPGKVQCDVCESMPDEPAAPVEMPFLRDELSRLLNHHSRENHSDTPDFVLAGFLMDALCAWERATSERDTFFGQNPRFAAMVNGPERKQPEPAAPSEMPEAVLPVARAVDALITASEYYEDEESIAVCVQAAEDLEAFWRTHSQPAKVRMSAELENVISAAANAAARDYGRGMNQAGDWMMDSIAAVRAQAAEVQTMDARLKEAESEALACVALYKELAKRDEAVCNLGKVISGLQSEARVKLPKVPVNEIRKMYEHFTVCSNSYCEADEKVIDRWLAELDAAERGE